MREKSGVGGSLLDLTLGQIFVLLTTPGSTLSLTSQVADNLELGPRRGGLTFHGHPPFFSVLFFKKLDQGAFIFLLKAVLLNKL